MEGRLEEKHACATVRGKFHEKKGIVNQDDLFYAERGDHTVMCVADGVGSHEFAAEGSHSVVRAVADAAAAYVRGELSHGAVADDITRRYADGVPEEHRSAAGTTCIFACVIGDAELMIGQIGDGMCYAAIDGEPVYVSRKDDDFSNIVDALSAEGNSASWTVRRFPLRQGAGIRVFMATDGISSDVIPGREAACAGYFAELLRRCPGDTADGELESILKMWGEDGSDDDKTAIVYERRVVA